MSRRPSIQSHRSAGRRPGAKPATAAPRRVGDRRSVTCTDPLPIWLGAVAIRPRTERLVEGVLALPHHRAQRHYAVVRLRRWFAPGLRPGPALVHRLVAEIVLGRRLSRREEVHHLNGVGRDNSPRNLVVCTQGWHGYFHQRVPLEQRPVPSLPQRRVPCACGCGGFVWRWDRCHRPRAFVHGHNARLQGRPTHQVPVRPPWLRRH
jgi:hypothetical protein